MSDYDYGYGGLVALYLVLLPILFILSIIGYVIASFFLMKIFEKAGVQGKWRAWVPVYNTLVLAKLGDLSPWAMLIAIGASAILGQIPFIGWIFGLVAVAAGVLVGWRVGLKLGKDWPLLLLWLIPGLGVYIWLGILAFTSSPWNPAIRPAPWASTVLKDTTVWQGIPVQPGAPVGQAGGAAGAYPPAGYQPPPGYQPPAPPAGYAPPAPPSGYAPPPAAAPQPPVTPPAAPPTEPPAAPPTEPPAAPEPPSSEPPRP
ncbi:large exoprotein [Microbacterium sp. SLBN-146]|uniref:large exoprotein n=1 Tax=Microbacterium sp. SLBN-146 TaxID=2768457 RepID=UPI00114F4C1E|nr:large exoprotein [Microbacterium sp. SLBN-146]TQJ32567.1 hypothetical protein FBY39_3078 [Microbacterium sp. SLBN-146]